MNGPLAGLRIVEFGGIGPAPFAGMLLADFGAEILRIDRVGGTEWPELPIVSRGRSALALDLKDLAAVEVCMEALVHADVLIEGFRPGVMERLGLGPDAVLARNPRLIYGRVTGWGQEGPLAHTAGHDINYLALSGALALLGDPADPPVPPVNLLGDYAGGSLYLVSGILAALHERAVSGMGQVVDAAIVDGLASMLAPIRGMASAGIADLDRGRNMLGGSVAPHYRCYACRDGRYVAVGPLEPRFRVKLCERLGLAADALADADSPPRWQPLSAELAAVFLTRTRDEWATLFGGSDACVAPVLTPDEAATHPQLRGRGTWVERNGEIQPSPAPRLSRTPAAIPAVPPTGEALLAAWRDG
jgi:alpha-methylacyl-CoA racemase